MQTVQPGTCHPFFGSTLCRLSGGLIRYPNWRVWSSVGGCSIHHSIGGWAPPGLQFVNTSYRSLGIMLFWVGGPACIGGGIEDTLFEGESGIIIIMCPPV